MIKTLAVLSVLASGLSLAQTTKPLPLEQRIAHADSSKYRNMKAVHDGPGALDYRPLFDAETLESNLFFMHRGVIEPKSGIGAHFHNQCEEMFIILDGEAQFTIDERGHDEGRLRCLQSRRWTRRRPA
jgi:mannose-6-phosphate isomerase-like protein (cupin superfamily)